MPIFLRVIKNPRPVEPVETFPRSVNEGGPRAAPHSVRRLHQAPVYRRCVPLFALKAGGEQEPYRMS